MQPIGTLLQIPPDPRGGMIVNRLCHRIGHDPQQLALAAATAGADFDSIRLSSAEWP
jgi:hypothetical protein